MKQKGHDDHLFESGWNTKMGIVTDIKQELRKSAALHINYSSRKRAVR